MPLQPIPPSLKPSIKLPQMSISYSTRMVGFVKCLSLMLMALFSLLVFTSASACPPNLVPLLLLPAQMVRHMPTRPSGNYFVLVPVNHCPNMWRTIIGGGVLTTQTILLVHSRTQDSGCNIPLLIDAVVLIVVEVVYHVQQGLLNLLCLSHPQQLCQPLPPISALAPAIALSYSAVTSGAPLKMHSELASILESGDPTQVAFLYTAFQATSNTGIYPGKSL